MRPASELETRRLNETFAALCAIPSPSRAEGAVAAYVRSEVEKWARVIKATGAKPD